MLTTVTERHIRYLRELHNVTWRLVYTMTSWRCFYAIICKRHESNIKGLYFESTGMFVFNWYANKKQLYQCFVWLAPIEKLRM